MPTQLLQFHRRGRYASTMIFSAFASFTAPSALAATPNPQPRRTITATAVRDDSINTDGSPTDPAWRDALPVGGFVQVSPQDRSPATQPTETRVAFDHHALYVLVVAHDHAPNHVQALLTRRDVWSPSDWVHVWLDPRGDGHIAYRFSLSARGVQQDARVVDGQGGQVDWDAVWTGAAKRTSDGWIAELRIPFHQVPYDPSNKTWGIQIGRTIARYQEVDRWNPEPRSSTRPLQHMGKLAGLRDLPPPWHAELIPYAGASWAQEPHLGKGRLTVGGDLRLVLSPELSMEATVLPDFGQIESDPSELNLGTQELFFAEKRPFFIRGMDNLRFSMGIDNGPRENETLLYTRRIGSAPPGDPDLSSDDIRDQPDYVPILGAMKWTGQTRDGWSFGLLQATTAQAQATLLDGSTRTVAPLTQYVAARIRKRFDGGKWQVGGFMGHVQRALTDNLADDLVRSASSAGIDVEHRVGQYAIIARGYGTMLAGSRQAIEAKQRGGVHVFDRPDARHLHVDPNATHLGGWGGTYTVGKLSGAPWRWAMTALMRSPGLDPNDLGYLGRADEQRGMLWVQYLHESPGKWLRKWDVDTLWTAAKTFGDERTDATGYETTHVQLSNLWWVYLGLARHAPSLSVDELHGGPALMLPSSWSSWAGVSTDNHKPVRVSVSGWGSRGDENSRRLLGGSVKLTVRPTSATEVQVMPQVSWETKGHQYVDTRGDGQVIVGRLDRETVSMTLRAAWAMSTTLSVQWYAMPYVSVGRYERFYQVKAPRASSYAARFGSTDYRGPEGFTFGQLRSNVVLRWEYAPGSILFAVWSHHQDRTDEAPAERLMESAGDLMNADGGDVLALKLTYWSSL